MRYFILMAALCSVADGQIATSSDRQSLTVSSNGSNAQVVPEASGAMDDIRRELAEIRKEIAQHGLQSPPATNPADPVVTVPVQIVPLPPVVTTIMPAVKKIKRRGLAYFFSPTCGPCHAWRNRNLDKLRRKGYQVWEVDMSIPANAAKHPGVQRLPSFTVCDRETGALESNVIVGGIEFEEVERLLGTESAIAESRPTEVPVPRQVMTMRDPAKRYADYGGTRYDLENWSRMCSMRNCQMCAYLNNAQAVYFASSITVKTEVPNPQSSSPADVVDEAIAIMHLTPADVLAELGSGNGLTSIRIAQATGCKIVGVELDPVKVAESRANVAAAGLSDRITIIEGNLLEFVPAEHGITAVYAYLYPELLSEITPQLSAGRITVCPGHKADGLDMRLIGQCWVRQSQKYQTVSLPASSIYSGERGSSHENRASLIAHLTEGIHSGRRSLAQLNAMTDDQLDSVHNQDHR